ncbi:CC0125/CC1285 family lipoprotein [Teredinibacter purpureus]|jgi:hypothetical protein|uniref:CC0125/CC1285 family lipoprotein n=1 Tax=Teredinibacter purpureus TaxID=2731756 RepID=UPI0005F7F3B3|nr:hypothetical protein [Teredinibacter purpureus]
MKNLYFTIFVLCLSGCATAYGKYGFSGGYKDKQLDDGSIEVSYQGNGTTSPETVELYWEKRAAELCPSGYDIVSKENGGHSSYYPVQVFHPLTEGVIKCLGDG